MTPLRCLAISNSYPPDHAGGYELGARNLLNALRDHAGWQNTVVTSLRKIPPQGVSPPRLTGFFPGVLGPGFERWRTKRTLLKRHTQVLEDLAAHAAQADVILVFNPRRLIFPEWTSIFKTEKPAFVFVSDYWPLDPLASDVFFTKSPRIASTGQLKDFAVHAVYGSGVHEGNVMDRFTGALFGSRYLQRENQPAFSRVPKQCVAHWGIEEGLFHGNSFEPSALKTFGFCGRAQPEKGLDLAVKAFRELALTDCEVRLVIASDLSASAYGKCIRQEIRKDSVLKDRVQLLGQVPHKALYKQFYSKIGILLFTSIWQEPFALTVLEAMASGVLVIASSTGGTPEVVDDSTGYLFKPAEQDSLIAACRQAMGAGTQNREKIEKAAKRIRSDHTLEQMAGKVDRFIRERLEAL